MPLDFCGMLTKGTSKTRVRIGQLVLIYPVFWLVGVHKGAFGVIKLIGQVLLTQRPLL